MSKKNDQLYLVTIAAGLFFLMQILPATVSTVWTDDFENTEAGWTTVDLTGDSSHWKKITDHPMDTVSYHSADTSWWCGVDTFYHDNMNDVLMMNTAIDLSGKTNPRLKFWYYLKKDGNDKAYVDVSTDGGTSWNEAVGSYSSTSTWTESDLELVDYIDSTINIRFRFTSNAFSSDYYGWFLDDIRVADCLPGDTLYTFDLEDGDVDSFIHYGIVGSDKWDTTAAKSSSATHSYAAMENAGSNWCALQTVRLNLSTTTAPVLCFDHWYQFGGGPTESNWSNGGIVEVTTDTSVTDKQWVKIYPNGGYPGYCYLNAWGNPLGDTSQTGDADIEGYYGSQTTFTHALFDISAYAGQESLWVRFSAGSDLIGWYGIRHWYIDDLMITDAGTEDTLYHDDMEHSEASLYTMEEVPAGNWWIKADSSWLTDAVNHQWNAVNPYYSQDTSFYCGNQSSQNGDGTYDFADNDNMLLNNALVSPFIDLSGVSGSDYLYIKFNERRKLSDENAYLYVEAQTVEGGTWNLVSTANTSSYKNDKEGNWVQYTNNISSYNAEDSIRFRFRTETEPGFSHVYWYIDDISVQKSDTALLDFVEAYTAVDTYTIKEKSLPIKVLALRAYDGDDVTLDTLLLTFTNVSGFSSSDLETLSDDITSGISVFDSSGNRLGLDVGASTWNGLTARLVFTGNNAIPDQYTDTYPFTVKIRTSASAANNNMFKVGFTSGIIGKASNGDMLRLTAAENTNSITVSNTIPAAPTGLEAHLASDTTEVDLVWNANMESDLWYYNIYRSLDSGFTPDGTTLIDTTTDTVYTDQNARDGKTLYYRVSAVDNGGDEGSASAQVDTILPVKPPEPPLGPNASLAADSMGINVSWSTAPEADLAYYNLYRDTVNFFIPETSNFYTVVNKDTNGYQDTQVRDSVTYYYRVSAVDSNDAESGFNDIAGMFVPVKAPAAPTGLAAVQNGDSTALIVTWNPNTEGDLGSYKLYRDTVNSFIPGPAYLLAQITQPDTVYIDSSVVWGKYYYYKVSALDSLGHEGEYSSQAESAVPVVLASFTAAAVEGGVLLSWSTVSEQDNLGWNVYRTNGEGETVQLNPSLIPAAGGTADYSFLDGVPVTGPAIYAIAQVDLTGQETIVGTLELAVTALEDGLLSSQDALLSISPVPVTSSAAIRFQVGAIDAIRITDGTGSIIRSITVPVGRSLIVWDGRNNANREVIAGIYNLISVRQGKIVGIQKVIKIK